MVEPAPTHATHRTMSHPRSFPTAFANPIAFFSTASDIAVVIGALVNDCASDDGLWRVERRGRMCGGQEVSGEVGSEEDGDGEGRRGEEDIYEEEPERREVSERQAGEEGEGEQRRTNRREQADGGGL